MQKKKPNKGFSLGLLVKPVHVVGAGDPEKLREKRFLRHQRLLLLQGVEKWDLIMELSRCKDCRA